MWCYKTDGWNTKAGRAIKSRFELLGKIAAHFARQVFFLFGFLPVVLSLALNKRNLNFRNPSFIEVTFERYQRQAFLSRLADEPLELALFKKKLP